MADADHVDTAEPHAGVKQTIGGKEACALGSRERIAFDLGYAPCGDLCIVLAGSSSTDRRYGTRGQRLVARSPPCDSSP